MPTLDTLGSIGESAVLARIFPRLPVARGELLGPGDDAAVVAAPDGRVVITTDMMVHGPDFRWAWSTPHDLGWKAAASNLSDLAAMGAVPTALVVAIAAPPDTAVDVLEGFADGLRDACSLLQPGCGVVGGDLSASTVFTIAVTAFGDLGGLAPVTRSGARPGDIVAIAGSIGWAGAGLRLLFERGVVDGEPDAAAAAALRAERPREIAAQLAPEPTISAGRDAALAGATAMIDLSDGLAIDAARLAGASGVALDFSSIAVMAGAGASTVDQVFAGGEDHTLLATFEAGAVLPDSFRECGSVVEGSGVHVDGVRLESTRGWDPYAGWDGAAG